MSNQSDGHITDEVLQVYLDGELQAEEQSEIETHLIDCKECVSRLAKWRSLFTEIERLPDLDQVIDFEPVVLAQLSKAHTQPTRGFLFVLAQAALAITLLAYVWQQISSLLPMGQLSSLLSLPIQTLRDMSSHLVQGLQDVLNQFISWSPSAGNLIGRIPQISSGNSLLLYLGGLAVMLWITGNLYLLRVNGQSEDASPQY